MRKNVTVKTTEELIDKYYEKMFDELIDIEGDNMTELLIEVRIATDGKTIRRSWHDRNEMLKEGGDE